MDKKFLLSVAAGALAASLAAHAGMPGSPMDHMSMHMSHQQPMADNDSRQPVNFPPEMRQHTLANMRDHLAALSEILGALSAGQYAKASRIATVRLGMDSPSAAGCQAGEGEAQQSKPASMDHQMAGLMPEGMRNIGLAMHQSASDFAAEAAKAAKSGDSRSALVALSKVTQQCTSCHAAYKMQ